MTLLPVAFLSAANTLLAARAITSRLALPADAATPGFNRTKTPSGPLRFGSGLLMALAIAVGSMPSETTAPVPMEVCSAMNVE